MQMTLDSYIKNPTGGRVIIAAQRDAITSVYTAKFNNIMLRCAANIPTYMYKDGERRYILYIKLPSETIDGLSYDVVLEFYTDDEVIQKATTLKDYFIRVFSNDPNFNYTYAHTFKKNNMIVPELLNKLDPKIKEPPVKTNPNTVVGYAKSLYSIYLYYDLRGFSQKAMWLAATPYKHGAELKRLVMDTPHKLIQTDKLRKISAAAKKGSMHIGEVDPHDNRNMDQKIRQINSVRTLEKMALRAQKNNKGVTMAKKVGKVKTIQSKK